MTLESFMFVALQTCWGHPEFETTYRKQIGPADTEPEDAIRRTVLARTQVQRGIPSRVGNVERLVRHPDLLVWVSW